MYKSLPSDIKKIKLDSDLYRFHKNGMGKSEFGMDNTKILLDNAFGLYSTRDLKKNLGPIRTQYFRISLTREGTANFDIGLEKYSAQTNTILFGIPGQMFSLYNVSDNFLAYYMLFSENYMADVFSNLNKKQQYPFLTYSGLQSFNLDSETADEIERIIMKMNLEIKENKMDCSDLIKLCIQQILLYANRCYSSVILSKNENSNKIQNLFNSYLKAVNQYFLTIRKVSDYAKMLHVSADHLNRAIKSCSDKTAHELIDEMILMEAKAYLLHTSLTISEISYKLVFSDPPHFNRFFKKYCALTPVEFRNLS